MMEGTAGAGGGGARSGMPPVAALGAVLLLGGVLNVWGITFGLPHVYTPDESPMVARALVMVRTGDLNPHYFTYPHLIYDLQAALLWLTRGALALWPRGMALAPPLHDQGAYYLAARLLSAACAVLMLAFTYGMGRALEGDRATGLLAALFLAVAPVSVQHAHYATVDEPSAAATALCGYACLRAVARARRPAAPPSPGRAPAGEHRAWWGGSRGALALGAIGAGLAGGTKYNAAVVVVCPLVAALALWLRARRHADGRPRPGIGALAGTLLGLGALAAATYLLTTPYTLLDWADFRGGLAGIALHYGVTGHPGAEGADNWRWYLSFLAGPGFGLPQTLLALGGLVAGLARRRTSSIVLASFVLGYFALLCAGTVRFERNLLPLLPFVAVFAAAATRALAVAAGRRFGRRAIALLVLAGLTLAATVPPAATALSLDASLTRTFTQSLALGWALGHIPAGATVAEENWEAPPLPPDRYRLVKVSALGKYDLAWYHGQGVTFMIADSWTDGAYLRGTRYASIAARYRRLFACGRRLTAIAGDGRYPGPDFTIYRLGAGPC